MEETKKVFATITQMVDVDEEDVKDLLCTAFEGGSNHWARVRVSRDKMKELGVQYSWEIPFVVGEIVEVYDVEGEPGDEPIGFLARPKMTRALRFMASGKDEKGNDIPMRHWDNFINENADAETADVFMQLATMGEIVYG
jgi:hypothetical protein